MKMESQYEPATGNLDLSYDASAQRIFDRMAKNVTPLFDLESTPAKRTFAEETDEDIGATLRLLAQLASTPSRVLRVRPLAMERLLGLTCCLALRLCDEQKSTAPLNRALVLLASVTPLPFLPLDLPPAAEIFDPKATNPGVWKSYETLRRWDPNTMPHLYAIQAHFLWCELTRLRRRLPVLKTLTSNLDTPTLLFRMAMEALAIDEISGAKTPERKK